MKLTAIYIMQYRYTGKVKIGISKDPVKRLRDVDDDIKSGRVRMIVFRRVPFARQFENYLHKLFAPARFTFRAAGSGKTEWFRLPIFSRILCVLLIWGYWTGYRILLYAFFVLAAAGLYAVMQDEQAIERIVTIINDHIND